MQLDFWKEEYTNKTIPSSFRTTPSQALVDFLKSHQEKLLKQGDCCLDVGAGKGRNSVFLAQLGFNVTALEFVEDACLAMKKIAKESHLPLKVVLQDLTKEWDVFLDDFQIVFDIYCYKHLIKKQDREHYRV